MSCFLEPHAVESGLDRVSQLPRKTPFPFSRPSSLSHGPARLQCGPAKASAAATERGTRSALQGSHRTSSPLISKIHFQPSIQLTVDRLAAFFNSVDLPISSGAPISSAFKVSYIQLPTSRRLSVVRFQLAIKFAVDWPAFSSSLAELFVLFQLRRSMNHFQPISQNVPQLSESFSNSDYSTNRLPPTLPKSSHLTLSNRPAISAKRFLQARLGDFLYLRFTGVPFGLTEAISRSITLPRAFPKSLSLDPSVDLLRPHRPLILLNITNSSYPAILPSANLVKALLLVKPQDGASRARRQECRQDELRSQ